MNPDRNMDRLDPRLAAAFEEVRGEPTPEVDWERLRRTIRDRAAPAFRSRRARRVLAVSRPMMPLALAASVAFALWLGPRVLVDGPPADLAELVTDVDNEAALVEALLADLTEQEFRMVVTGHANPEALLAVAVEGR